MDFDFKKKRGVGVLSEMGESYSLFQKNINLDKINPKEKEMISGLIDHTFLKPNGKNQEVFQEAQIAIEYKFASFCVYPYFIKSLKDQFKDSLELCSVVGFPSGMSTTHIKYSETSEAIANGADEIDMVIHLSAAMDENYAEVEKDIRSVVKAAEGRLVKVILETGYFHEIQIANLCKAALNAGAHYVKTSTGFGPRGASVSDIKTMRETVKDHMGVKASGGIRDFLIAFSMIRAGATRIGASASLNILS